MRGEGGWGWEGVGRMGGCVGSGGVIYYLCWEGGYEEGGEGVDEGEKGLYGNWDSCSGLGDGTDRFNSTCISYKIYYSTGRK